MKLNIASVVRLLMVLTLAAVMTACGGKGGRGGDEASTADDMGTSISGEGATTVGTGEDEGLSPEEMAARTGLKYVFYFDFDQATLDEETQMQLDAQAARLRNTHDIVRLEGHADERGTREYNLALGERRAKAVANYLVLRGIDRSRIEVISYGEEKPAQFGQDEASYRLNRRVELK